MGFGNNHFDLSGEKANRVSEEKKDLISNACQYFASKFKKEVPSHHIVKLGGDAKHILENEAFIQALAIMRDEALQCVPKAESPERLLDIQRSVNTIDALRDTLIRMFQIGEYHREVNQLPTPENNPNKS